MKRKVIFTVALADGWDWIDRGYTFKLPSPIGKEIWFPSYEVEFDWDEKEDIVSAACEALRLKLQSEYPRMTHMIYYWDFIN